MKTFLLSALVSLTIAFSVIGPNSENMAKNSDSFEKTNEQLVDGNTTVVPSTSLFKQNRTITDFVDAIDFFGNEGNDRGNVTHLGLGDFSGGLDGPSIGGGLTPPISHYDLGDQTIPEDTTNNDCGNDFSYSPQFVPTEGVIRGELVLHSQNEMFSYAVSEIDNDWYRFSIYKKANYTFSFDTYNNGCFFEIRRFSNNSGSVPAYQVAHDLIYTSYRHRNYRTITLECGTYFIHVTAMEAANVDTYSLTYFHNANFGQEETITLNDDEFSQNHIIVWENENNPAGYYRWTEPGQIVCHWTTENGNVINYDGYVDPIYMEDKQWVGDDAFAIFDNRPDLDSIMYIGGHDELMAVHNIMENMLTEISDQCYIEHIREVELQARAIIKNCVMVAVEIVATIGAAYTAGASTLLPIVVNTVCEAISYGLLAYETAEAICEAISFSCPSNYYVTREDMVTALTRISDVAEELATHNNGYLRIPRYRYFCQNTLTDDPVYPYGTNEIRVANTFFTLSPSVQEKKYYRVFKEDNLTVSETQYIPAQNMNDGRVFKGKFRRFSDYSDFWDKTNYVIEGSLDNSFVSDNGMSYSITKRMDQKYYIDIVNTTDNRQILFSFNNKECEENEGRYFNLKADCHDMALLLEHDHLRMCLEDRPYFWVREYHEGTVIKLTLVGNETCALRQNFGYEFMKLSIIKFKNNKWTIRVRNLYNQNLKVYYNAKMCFKDDGFNWRNLSDVKSLFICYNTYEDLVIPMNWGADAVAVSVVIGNIRYISVANHLGLNGSTSLDYYTNTKYMY